MVNSKQKGASFEREICVKLSKWVTNGEREDVFWRSAMSGGRATVGYKQGKHHTTQVGDISCIHPSGHRFNEYFAIECKFYAYLDYQGIITGKGKLLAFWAEITKQAERYGKHPMLFARQNRFPTTICLAHSGLNDLGLGPHKTILISRPYDLYILTADRFFSECTPFV
jgi:hypothetical protein